MSQFTLGPSILEMGSYQEFVSHFQLTAEDLILSNEPIYANSFASFNLPCPLLFLENYGHGEPSDEMVDALYRDMPKNIRRIFAIGGGGIMDVAKILALDFKGTTLGLFDGEETLAKNKELILVPTTCGTGSEVTNISILALNSRGTKKGLVDKCLLADFAILLPDLLQGLPFHVFATSSIDALIHAVESSLSPKANPTTLLFGYRAIELIVKGYLQIRDQGQDARFTYAKDFLLAANYAGIAFGNAGCAAVHALSYPLGAVYHVPHGEANYALFTGVMEQYMAIKSDGAIAELNRFLAALLHCEPLEVYVELEKLLNLLLPKKQLRAYGMTEANLQGFTDSVRENQGRLMANNFVPLDDETVYKIYRNLY